MHTILYCIQLSCNFYTFTLKTLLMRLSSVIEDKLVQPSVSEGKLVQPSVSEGKLVQPSVSEGKLAQPSVSVRRSWYSQV